MTLAGFGFATLRFVIQWPVRIASVVALTVLAYGWGDWFAAPERPALDGILLGLLTMVLLFALARLYRPGGLAAFEPVTVRAPGEAAIGPGDPVRFDFDPARVHRFDEAGRAMRP